MNLSNTIDAQTGSTWLQCPTFLTKFFSITNPLVSLSLAPATQALCISPNTIILFFAIAFNHSRLVVDARDAIADMLIRYYQGKAVLMLTTYREHTDERERELFLILS